MNAQEYLKEALRRLHRLQRADTKTKRRWLFFFSALSMIMVVSLWLVYLNVTLPRFAEGAKKEKTEEKESFWKTMRRGIEVMSENFSKEFETTRNQASRTLNAVKNWTGKSNEFQIEGKKEDLRVENNE